MTRRLRNQGLITIGAAALAAACSNPQPAASENPPVGQQAASAPAQSPVERGQYLVTLGGCHDCHSPKNMTPEGPVPDMTNRPLSGHPATEKLAPIPAGLPKPGAWSVLANDGFTAYVGPWGTSFSRNLTPDQATGIGSWTEDMFIQTIRQGRHQGTGRPLLPPMPWQMYRNMTDDDLKAVFAYLRTIPATSNPVPEPIPPAGAPTQ
jgi:mono/diheme cytochrome c family protein